VERARRVSFDRRPTLGIRDLPPIVREAVLWPRTR
jgi:hypothetical protein